MIQLWDYVKKQTEISVDWFVSYRTYVLIGLTQRKLHVIGLYETDFMDYGGWWRTWKTENLNTNLISIIFKWFRLIFAGVGV